MEELLTGPEISILAISDGYTIVALPAAQDHKRIGEGDTGPNTGGMGAYAPAPVATPDVLDKIMKETLRPTIDGMRKEGLSYQVANTSKLPLKLYSRVPVSWDAVYRVYAHPIWSESSRVQRSLWRPRNRGVDASFG